MYTKPLIFILVLGFLILGSAHSISKEAKSNFIDERFVHIENPVYLRFYITINNILKNYIKLTNYKNLHNDRTFFLLGFDGAIKDNAYSNKAMDLIGIGPSESNKFTNIPSGQCTINFMTRESGAKEIHAIFDTFSTVPVGIRKCITIVVGYSYGLNIQLKSNLSVLDILDLQFLSIQERGMQ